ncbi:hypothetical protein [Erythrobacter sp. JK5]|uniref:hypothetical protein n=1 Tax=Erythrobacter sp. JK5 TaxID=2829500 RepID=UPI001BADA1CB|nr:hypothetical protein [Erythrobacter sp. JK5]QUL37205.1 hypothetical protein KDC96_12560 [Erythrobacter sp. JK5]
MSALPPDQFRIMRETVQRAARPLGALADRWDALHVQAGQLAELAQIAPERAGSSRAAFSERLAAASEAQRQLAWQGMEDIDAMMQPGLTALRTITARGQDAAAPALALWREFHAARDVVLFALGVEARFESADAA